jgi:hypothetical protein
VIGCQRIFTEVLGSTAGRRSGFGQSSFHCFVFLRVGVDGPLCDDSRWLHAVLFEAYLIGSPGPNEAYYAVELLSAEFPIKFSSLFVPFAKPQKIDYGKNREACGAENCEARGEWLIRCDAQVTL